MSVSNLAFNEYGGEKVVRNDVFDVFSKFVQEKPYSAAKTFYVGLDVFNELGCVDGNDPTWKAAGDHAKLFKLSRSPFECFRSLNRLRNTTWSWWQGAESGGKKKEISNVVRDAAGCVNPFYEMGAFLTKAILFIPKASIETLKGVNGCALTFIMSWKVCEHLSVLAKNDTVSLKGPERVARKYEVESTLLQIVRDISFIALGVLNVLGVFFGFVFSPVTFTIFSATSVVFTILHFYHENYGKEKKLT